MDIRRNIVAAGIECHNAACVSLTEYVCYNTTSEAVDTVLKSIGVYPEYRAFQHSDCVYINRMYTNGKSWD